MRQPLSVFVVSVCMRAGCGRHGVVVSFQTGPQLGRSYRGVLQCAVTIGREEGVGVFFRGWVPLFTRVAPLYVLYLPLYEQVRRLVGLDYMT